MHVPDNPRDQPPEGSGTGSGWPEAVAVAASLDARGLRCPEPLMVMRNRIRDLAPGDVLHVQATDPSTERDFRDFCRYLDHELVAVRQGPECYEFLIRKGGA